MTETTMLLESAKGLGMSIKQLSDEIHERGLQIDLAEVIKEGPESLLSKIDSLTEGSHELSDLVIQACLEYDEFIDGVLK